MRRRFFNIYQNIPYFAPLFEQEAQWALMHSPDMLNTKQRRIFLNKSI